MNHKRPLPMVQRTLVNVLIRFAAAPGEPEVLSVARINKNSERFSVARSSLTAI